MYIHKECVDNAIKLFDSIVNTKHSKRFYDLLNTEVENVRQLYEHLNQLKQSMKSDRSEESVERMLTDIATEKRQFNGQQNALDVEVSGLFGLNLLAVTLAIRTALDIQ